MSAGSDREKVKETKKLVKLALDEGWTEAEVARKCRVTAEKVSTWKNGKARGRRHELKPLLDAFGWRLRRGKLRVYLVVDPEAGPKWEETDEGRRMVAELTELRAIDTRCSELIAHLSSLNLESEYRPVHADTPETIRKRAEDNLAELRSSVTALRAVHAARLAGEDAPLLEESYVYAQEPRNLADDEVLTRLQSVESKYEATQRVASMTDAESVDLERRQALYAVLGHPPEHRVSGALAGYAETQCVRSEVVSGAIVFSHTFVRPIRALGRDPRIHRLPLQRWRVHHDEHRQRFILARQRRWLLSPRRRDAWGQQLSRVFDSDAQFVGAGFEYVGDVMPAFVDSRDDAARWLSEIEPPMDLEALLAYVDASIHQPGRPHGPNDEVTLPFLLRKALIQQGFDVPGVVFHGFD